MRFNAAAVLSTALLAGAVQAHGDHAAQKVVEDASAAAEASAQSVLKAATEAAQSVASSASSVAHAALPTFTVSSGVAIQAPKECRTNLSIANRHQGRLPRAVHRGLGREMEAISRKEGHEGS